MPRYIVITSYRCVHLKARLVRIGNSQGARLPKPVIEEVGPTDEVQVQVRGGAVVIRPVVRPRSGWAEAARLARCRGSDRLLDQPTATRFNIGEWQWR